jgi:hypothetical protein
MGWLAAYLSAVALGSYIALKVYFRQKEYEIAKQRYLEGGVDVVAAQVEQALGVVSHNWARCLNLCKSFRDAGVTFEVKELERGFLPLDSSQFRQVAHHRIGSLIGSKTIWDVYQHAMAYANDAHSRITMEIPEVLRIRTTTDLISADHENIAAKLLADLHEIHSDGFRFATLISELHTLGRLLESVPLSQKAVAIFHKRPEVQAIVARLRSEFPDAVIAPELKANPSLPVPMMRATAFAAMGCFLGILSAAGSIFLLGLLLQSLGIQLHGFEAGRRRNFNFALVFTLAVAVIGTWRGYRFGKR